MTEFGESSLPKESSFPPEQREKMAYDIQTLSNLRQYAQDNNFVFVLTGGYAVDALDGGKVSRFHSDMDGVFFIPESVSMGEIKVKVGQQLALEKTKWKLHTSDDWFMEYREDADDKPWEMRRRIELDIFEPDQQRNIVTKTLQDFNGNAHEFEVISVAGLMAAKILSMTRLAAMSPEEREKEGFREMKESDTQDFLRLMYHDDFDREEVLRELAYYNQDISEGELSREEAELKAFKQWTETIRILSA